MCVHVCVHVRVCILHTETDRARWLTNDDAAMSAILEEKLLRQPGSSRGEIVCVYVLACLCVIPCAVSVQDYRTIIVSVVFIHGPSVLHIYLRREEGVNKLATKKTRHAKIRV